MNKELQLNADEISQRFFALRTFEDLAILLDVPKNKLYYYAFKAKPKDHYKVFDVPKKSGGFRRICAPSSPVKIIQQKLNLVLQVVYVPKASVHGFVYERNILTNAKRHLENRRFRRFVFNLDLRDFFPSITESRIEGLLKAKPYNLPENIARAIARIACCGRVLPQGAPSSPVISNMICAKMDTQLKRLAQEARCVYTRYADDITFSTTVPSFPTSIAKIEDETGMLIVGDSLREIIESNGFEINLNKVRVQSKYQRQEITGLTVNEFPNVKRKYVRQIRAMLHAWEKFGLDAAEKEYNVKYSNKPNKKAVSFKQVVRGKIEFLKMVRGEENLIYINFRDKLSLLDPDYKVKISGPLIAKNANAIIVTEGKSDWKHLKAALKKFQANNEFEDLNIKFLEYEDDQPMGDGELLKRCKSGTTYSLDQIHIHIFDRDKPEIIRDVNDQDKDYKRWGEKLFSFSIPIPSNRVDNPLVCIELYYQDNDIKKKDKSGRRLFLSNEFDKKSGRNLSEDLNCLDIKKIRGQQLTIIDDLVFDSNNENNLDFIQIEPFKLNNTRLQTGV